MIKKAAPIQVINKSIKLSCGRTIPLRDASLCVDAVFDTLAAALAKGEKAELRGFGTFLIREVKARKSAITTAGNNVVPAHSRIVFRPSLKLRQSVWNKVNN